MKRIWLALGVFSVIIFGLCTGATFIYGALPELIPSAVGSYRFVRGLLWFLQLLPAILISGFIVGCCVQWKSGGYNSRERFSAAMMDRFKAVFIIGLAMVALLTVNQEIFVNQLKKRQKVAENNPALVQKNVFLAQYYLNQMQPKLAWHYAEEAYKIDSKDQTVLNIYRATHDAMEITLSEMKKQEEPELIAEKALEGPIETEEKGYSVKTLLQKSEEAAAEERWFDAHYWARLAMETCNTNELNYTRAVEYSNNAWNNMCRPRDFDNQEEAAYYSKKKEGYAALNSGDFLKSYYLFLELSQSSQEHAEDPDVIRYLERSKEKLEHQYFFIDETEGMENLINASGVYFSLKLADGFTDVIYIDKMASLKTAGGMVRYIDGFTMIRFDPQGDFLYKMYVPYAKMVAASVSVFDQASLNAMGVSKKWKNIPQVYLQSVDRQTEGRIGGPEYIYEADKLPASLQESLGMKDALFPGTVRTKKAALQPGSLQFAEDSLLFLPMPFEDLDALTSLSGGSESMNLVSLNKFLSKADYYGFPSDIYIQSLTCRGSYPLLVLIMVIFAAIVAWNYRFVDERSVFKFRWIFFLPILFCFVLLMYDGLLYLSSMINFVLVGFFGGMALLASFVLNIIVLLVVSIIFLARRSQGD